MLHEPDQFPVFSVGQRPELCRREKDSIPRAKPHMKRGCQLPHGNLITTSEGVPNHAANALSIWSDQPAETGVCPDLSSQVQFAVYQTSLGKRRAQPNRVGLICGLHQRLEPASVLSLAVSQASISATRHRVHPGVKCTARGKSDCSLCHRQIVFRLTP